MTSISEKISCAKRGGPTYIETVRVDPVSLKCPNGTYPCSRITSATDTVCMEKEKHESDCPIIDVFATHQNQIPMLTSNHFKVTEDGYDQDGLFKSHIAFSKLTTRFWVGQDAVISTKLNT